MIKSLKDLLDKFSRFTNSLVYDGGICKRLFGLEIKDGNLIKESDIKNLPFYEFWLESAKGSTCAIIDGEEYIYLSDWESFANLFIKTGKHRFQKRD